MVANRLSTAAIDAYVDQVFAVWSPDEIRAKVDGEVDYSKYQNNPVEFITSEMGISLTDDVIKMAESVRDNRITVVRSATGTGKSHVSSAIAAWFYKSFPDSRVYTTANPYENQKILWSELTAMSEGSSLFASDKITTMHIERSSKDFITALTVPTTGTDEAKEAKFSGKHHEHMLFIVDEGDTVPDFAYRGIEGCMSGGHVRLLILFNPRNEMGRPYRLERDGNEANIIHLSAFNHPNVITGEDKIPGAVDRQTTVRRVNMWCRPLVEGEKPDSECFELPDFLEGVVGESQSGSKYPPLSSGQYKILDPAFSYMVLGEYPAQGETQLINREWIARARVRWDLHVSQFGEIPPAGSIGVGGLDVAEFGRDLNCLIYNYSGFITKPTTWGGVDPLVSGDRAADDILTRGNVTRCNVDATGVGSGTAPQMIRRGVSAVAVKVASAATLESELGVPYLLRDQLWWLVREWLRTDTGAMLPPDEELLEELGIPTYQIRHGKIRIMSKDTMKEHLGRSPNKADALCLTKHSDWAFGDRDLS